MATAAAANGEQPKKKSKLLLIIILAVVLLGGGGGAAWFFMRPSADGHSAKPQPPKPSVFLPLEMFTGNLMPQDGQPQYIQLGITLKLADQATADLVKDRTPEVRNRVLMVLSGKKGVDLLPVAGKQKLASEIEVAIRQVVGPALAAKAPPPVEEEEEAPAKEAKETQAGDGAEEAPKPKRAPKRAGAPMTVLFTSFIIQ
jgi:flagellar FliL protein